MRAAEVISMLQQRGVILKKAHKETILKALCQSATVDSEPVVTPAKCRTCLRYSPRDHYCGHKLRIIRDGEGIICAGKGYSPNGSPWKECLS